jgi:hypothetical protein
MNQKLTQKICFAAPTVFSKDFGFETQNGWYDIILKVGLALHRMNLENNWTDPLVASQVKEKFGTLSLYLLPTTGDLETAMKIIREAMRQSAKTCEYCGKPGKMRGKGWMKTLCVDCALKDEKITLKEYEKEKLDMDQKV